MKRFAFVIHPLKAKDIAQKYPILGIFPDKVIEGILRRINPKVMGHISGIKTPSGEELEGIFIGCPYTPHQFLNLPEEEVTNKIADCAKLAEELECSIVGLGAFTSVAGDGGITVSKRVNIPVTTGNSYTVATAIEGALEACRRIGIDTKSSTLAVVGATGSIGKTCASILAPDFCQTILIGRDLEKTKIVSESIPGTVATTEINDLSQADLIVTVTSSDAALIQPEHLKSGSIVCDVARPRDVSIRVAKERPDVLVIEGGVVTVPGDHVDMGVDFGFPPGTAYACMSETMMLALEEKPWSLTLGKEVTVEQVEETRRLAQKHGFKISGFRSFEKAVDDESIERVRLARSQAPNLIPSHG